MKKTILVSLLIFPLLWSCFQKKVKPVSLYQLERRNYFNEIIFAKNNYRDSVLSKKCVEILKDLNEKPLSELQDSVVYRLIILPSWSKPSIIRIGIDSKDTNLAITFKCIGGPKDNIKAINTELKMGYKKEYFMKNWLLLEKSLEECNFWKSKNDEHCNVADGTLYILEGKKNNQYNLLVRFEPEVCRYDNSKEFTNLIRLLGLIPELHIIFSL